MDWSDIAETTLLTLYSILLVLVSTYGFHRYVLVYLYYRHRRNVPKQAGEFAELPHVTIQLPMYNERSVARRIIEKTCEIDYPREKLQIQVLDDSTDDTVQIASAAVEAARAKGIDIEYIHRDDRTGFKAGALANGMKSTKGEFISIFDADFIPDPTYLKRSIQYFTDPKVCAVQTRWEHLNRDDSMLTRSQAIFLDGHFAIEHVARNRSDRFMSFNGTAGTWRRRAIDESGGWQHDTLTEDLDLSYRAQLLGWKFVFLPDLTAPAELPPEMNGFKAQQFRWTKGGTQVAIKLLPRVMLSKAPLKVKIEAFFHLTNFTMHLYMMVLVLLLFPTMYLKMTSGTATHLWQAIFDISVFMLATMSAGVFYTAGQYELFGDWKTCVKYMGFIMALGVGMSVSNAKAVMEALLGRKSDFVRTPKYGEGRQITEIAGKKRKRNYLPYVEFALGVYFAACTIWAIMDLRTMGTAVFLVMFTVGFFYVSILSFLGERQAKLAKQPKAVKVQA